LTVAKHGALKVQAIVSEVGQEAAKRFFELSCRFFRSLSTLMNTKLILNLEVSVVPSLNAYITIRVEGPEVGAGRMRLSDFLRITGEFSTAANRVAMVLQSAKSSTRGRRSDELLESLSLDLVAFTEGSPAAVVHLERSLGQGRMPFDLGENAYRALLQGLEKLDDDSIAWPEGFDVGVGLAIIEMAKTFRRGVTRVSFVLNHRVRPVTASLDQAKFEKVRARLAKPEPEVVTLEGRLMMVDLKESGPRFRIDRSFGTSVICDFGDELGSKIPEFLKAYVRVRGRAEYNSEKEIIKFHVLSIERVGDAEGSSLFSVLAETPRFDPNEFWKSKSIEELAKEQGLEVPAELERFIGGWPQEELNDDFESAYVKWRQEHVIPSE
jgi:hypothetical protein